MTDSPRSGQEAKVMAPALALAPPPAPEFRDVYVGHIDYVVRALRRLGAAPRDVPDLCHDVFLVVFHRLNTYDPRRPLRPWLFGIALRVVADFHKKPRHRREALAETPDLGLVLPQAEAHLEATEAREVVLACLGELPIERRAVFTMHELDGFSVPEIADALGIPLNTAYSRLRVARQEFTAAALSRLPRGDR